MLNKKLLLLIFGIVVNFHSYSQWADITSTIGGGITATTNMAKPYVFDLNNDNYPDFLVPVLTNVVSPYTKFWRLYKNNGNSTFTDVTTSYGLPTNLSLSTLGFIDYNGDGYKDLYFITATGLQIFKNNNGTSFTDVSTQLGIVSAFFTSGETTSTFKVFDYDLDGDEDLLYTRTVSGANTLTAIVNNGTSFSTKVNILTSIPGGTAGINFSFFDMDNDGDFDIVFDGFTTTSQYSNGITTLYKKDATGYINTTSSSGLVNGLPGEISTIDINQDGNLDIVKGGADCCSSPLYRVFIGNGTGVFTEQTSTFSISNGAYKYSGTLTDFDNDTDFDFSWSSYTSTGAAPFRLYVNNGSNVFAENATTYGLNLGVTSGGVPIDDNGNGVWMDLDKDGDLDIILNREGGGSTSTTGNLWVKRNPLQGNYINIKLNGCGVNKSGIGAKIKLVVGANTKWLYYEKSPDGNITNGTDTFHFGLGTATLINSITVYWPNNTTTVLNNVTGNQFLTIGGGAGGSSAPTGSTAQTFCSGSTVANLTATGTNIKWYATSTGGTALASTTALVNGTTYYASQTTNGCESTTRLAVTITLNNPTVSASATTVCSGQPTTLTASSGASTTSNFSVGSVGPAGGYVFYDKGSVTNGWRYLEVASSDYGNPLEWGCDGTNIPGTSTAIGTGQSNTNLIIQNCNSINIAARACDTAVINGFSDWYLPSRDDFNLIYQNLNPLGVGNFINSNGNQWNRYWTSSQIGAFAYAQDFTPYFQQITQKVNQNKVRPIRQFATGTPFSTYLWSTGATTASISVNPTSTTQYWVDVTTNGVTCRKNITITVNSTTSSPTGSTSQTFCSGATVANLTAIGTNIKWYSTSTSGTALASTTALVNGTTYYASQTVSGCESTTRLAVTVTLNNPTVSASATTVCSGQPTTLTASSGASTTSNFSVGSMGPSGGYVFYDQGSVINGWRYLEAAPANIQNSIWGCGDVNIAGATSLAIGSGLSNTNAIVATCTTSTIAAKRCLDHSVNGYNDWYLPSQNEFAQIYQNLIVNNLGNFNVGAIPSFGTLYWTSTQLTAASGSHCCLECGGNFYQFSKANEIYVRPIRQFATGTPFSNYLWSTGATTVSISVTPTATTQYWVDVTTNGVTCRKFITITVTSTTPAPTGNATQTLCSGSTVSNLTATGTNIKWYATSTGGTALASTTALVNGTTYYASQTVNGCESTSRLAVIITINGTPSLSGSLSTCNGLTTQIYGSGSPAAANPWVSSNPSIATITSSGLVTGVSAGTTTITYTTSTGCQITATYTVNALPIITGTLNVCIGLTTQLTAIPTPATTNAWVSSNPLVATINNSGLVTGVSAGTTTITYTNSAGCQITKIITVNSTIPAPTGNTTQTFCSGSTVANLTATGTTIKWYSTSTGGTALASTTALVNGTTYYASQTVNGCESTTRLAVTVSLNATATIALTSGYESEFSSGCYFSDIVYTLGNGATGVNVYSPWPNWITTTTIGTTVTISFNNSDTPPPGLWYFEISTTGGCGNATRTFMRGINGISGVELRSPQGTDNQTICINDPIQDVRYAVTTVLGFTGFTYIYAEAFGLPAGVTLSRDYSTNEIIFSGTPTETGVFNYFIYNALCGGPTFYGGTITVNSTTPAPTGNTAQTLCSGSTIADLTATGANIKWYAASTGGTALASTTALINGTTYYASQAVNGCESTTRLAVTVSLNATATIILTSGEENIVSSGCYFSDDIVYTIGNGATGVNVYSQFPSWITTTTIGTTVTISFNNSDTPPPGLWYFEISTTGGCGNATRTFMRGINGISGVELRSPQGTDNQTICINDPIQDVRYAVTTVLGFTGFTYIYAEAFGLPAGVTLSRDYSTNEIIFSGTPTETGVFNYFIYNALCGGPTFYGGTITVNSTPAPTGANNQTMIQGSTITNLVVTGQNIVWYSTPFEGTPLTLNTPLVNGTTYYASQTINGCESQDRLPVTVQITLNNDEFDTINIVYYPNPVIDILYIKASTELKNAKICNLLGQTIFQQRFNSNEIQLNMSDFTTGTYFVIVESDDRKETFKILKK